MLPLSTKLAKLVDIRRRIGHTHGSAALVFTVIQLSARARTPGLQMAVRMVSQTRKNTGNESCIPNLATLGGTGPPLIPWGEAHTVMIFYCSCSLVTCQKIRETNLIFFALSQMLKLAVKRKKDFLPEKNTILFLAARGTITI
jgi:hypothetical protein